GAVVSYNPGKPGRPSHSYHTYLMAGTRLVLGVEVRAGNEHTAKHTRHGLLQTLDDLPPGKKPQLVRGDSAFGDGPLMAAPEARCQPYLSKLKLSKNVKRHIGGLFRQSGWTGAGQGREGMDGELALAGREKKRRAVVIISSMAVPLQPVRTFNKNGVEWRNKLIFGDNLQAMKTLLEMKRRGELCNADGTPGVRLVYIDPPFATKRDFAGSQDQQAYQDKVIGAAFLEFLRRRLVMIRELLAEDGYVFVHLDQKKSHYVKALMDEIFGEQNFLNHIIWSYRRWPSRSRNFQSMHDDILMYAAKATNTRRAFHTSYEAPSESYVKRFQGKTQILDEETGTRKITIDEPTKGMPMRDVWPGKKSSTKRRAPTEVPSVFRLP
ncbi:MAG: transposase, partial [Betaproteobacteria bacterium]|nr:transposase [Betaproteobacteria bacterium]